MELARALIQDKRELANLIKDYEDQKEVIEKLEKSLEVIKKESGDSLVLIESMKRTIEELKARNEVLSEIITQSEETDLKQVQEFQKALDREIARGNKKMLVGGAVGFVLGIILILVAK
jgi:chromosome segregation ATPase